MKAIEVIDFRIGEIVKLLSVVKGCEGIDLAILDYEARLDELESLKGFLLKMEDKE